MADPYQLWRRGDITYATYLARKNEDNIVAVEVATTPIASDYDMVVADTTTLAGSVTVAAPNGVLIANTGSLVINSPAVFTIDPI
jgi:hypothetical protein